MFTGIVETVGTVALVEPEEGGIRLGIRAPDLVGELAAGDSICVDGVCQTVTEVMPPVFAVQAVRTTLSRTTLGELDEGRRVNLERAVRAGQPLGGHLVQGHVDAVAEITGVEPVGETVFVRARLPEEVWRVTVLHGSLALDGVSLTVNTLKGSIAEVAVIPYTWENTNFSRLSVGDRANVEADLIGKYVARLLAPYERDR